MRHWSCPRGLRFAGDDFGRGEPAAPARYGGLEATLDRDGGHPGDPEYKVLEAVLVKTKAGSAWTVRFGAKGNDDDEVIVAIALDKLHEMSLARSYSLAEIKALTDVTAYVAGESAEE